MKVSLITCLILHCAGFISGQGSFTNYVNQEKLYTLEDELIALTDVMIYHERSVHGDNDEHDIYDIKSVIESTKAIHQAVMDARNYTVYISHPINVYHMTKRFVNDWSDVVKRLQEGKSCAKEMQVKVQNIQHNLPKKEKLIKVTESILNMQDIHGLSAAAIVNWDINGSLPLSPLTLNEAFEFASVAYERKMYHLTREWADYIIGNYDDKNAEFTLANVYNLMSSSNFMMERPREAVVNLEKILEIDPKNVAAERNRKFIQARIDNNKPDAALGPVERKTKIERSIARLCGNFIRANVTRQSRLFCTFTRERGDGEWFIKPRIKTEVLSLKPRIFMFHDMTTRSVQTAVRYLGYERMRDQLSKHLYRFPDGLESTWVIDNTLWKWIPNLQRSLESIAITNLSPDPSVITVKNIGMDGYRVPRETIREEYQLGTYVVFLTDKPRGGGEIVFPSADIRVTPTAGSILFFDSKAGRQASFCPVLGDAEWVGMYPLLDKMSKDVCHKEKVLRPKNR